MEPDQNRPANCICCEVMLPALEETVQQQRILIKVLRLTIKDLKNDNDGKRYGTTVRLEDGNGQAGAV
jgi:hypothetical protein